MAIPTFYIFYDVTDAQGNVVNWGAETRLSGGVRGTGRLDEIDAEAG